MHAALVRPGLFFLVDVVFGILPVGQRPAICHEPGVSLPSQVIPSARDISASVATAPQSQVRPHARQVCALSGASMPNSRNRTPSMSTVSASITRTWPGAGASITAGVFSPPLLPPPHAANAAIDAMAASVASVFIFVPLLDADLSFRRHCGDPWLRKLDRATHRRSRDRRRSLAKQGGLSDD